MIYIVKNKKFPPKKLQHDPRLKDKFGHNVEYYILEYLEEQVPQEWFDNSYNKQFKVCWLFHYHIYSR